MFLEPEPGAAGGGLPLYRKVTDAKRLAELGRGLDNDAARRALDFYARARGVATVRRGLKGQPAEYVIALVSNGNNAAIGFRLETPSGTEEHPGVAYVQLDPEQWRFEATLLHETGHVALAMLAGGREIPKRAIAAIPHSVAALTDRGTAFDEGFAISLEALAAHLSSATEVARQYRHEQFLVGPQAKMRSEYYRPSADLLAFAQTRARYAGVRDDVFAFAPAYQGPDYLRVQLETARDFATLRDADQLLASEGFTASVFFTLLVRGEKPPDEDTLRSREKALMTALASVLSLEKAEPDAPLLLGAVVEYGRLYPAEWRDAADVLLDLSRGVFLDPGAAAMWRAHYLAALALDLEHLAREKIDAARENWRAALLERPGRLYSRVGPQLRCEVAGRTVNLVGMGGERPLSFDLNTVEDGVMRMVPGITEAEVESWSAQRASAPFASVDDFRARAGLSPASLSALRF